MCVYYDQKGRLGYTITEDKLLLGNSGKLHWWQKYETKFRIETIKGNMEVIRRIWGEIIGRYKIKIIQPHLRVDTFRGLQQLYRWTVGTVSQKWWLNNYLWI